MKLYELTYLLPSNLAGEEQKKYLDNIRTLVEEVGGVLDSAPPQQTIKSLAYPIKKNTSAVMGLLNFYLSPEKTPELSSKIEKQEAILRHLLVVKGRAPAPKKSRMRPTRIMPSATLRPPSLRGGVAGGPHPEKESKIEMEKLEEKLEEILKE